jgi:hypothetical protein
MYWYRLHIKWDYKENPRLRKKKTQKYAVQNTEGFIAVTEYDFNTVLSS